MVPRPLLPSYSAFIILVLGIAVFSCGALGALGKPEAIPAVFFSMVTALLGFWACSFTYQKLRLDLFEKRFEIYTHTLTFCSTVMQQGSLNFRGENREQIRAAIEAAHQSFRGIGHHKAKALFGSDISELFEQLNQSYAYITAFGDQPARGGDPQEYWHHVKRIAEVASALPDKFKSYIYFGDVRLS